MVYRPMATWAKRQIEAASRGYDDDDDDAGQSSYLAAPKQPSFSELLQRLIERIGPAGRGGGGGGGGDGELPVSGKPAWTANARQSARKESAMWWWWSASLDVCVRGPKTRPTASPTKTGTPPRAPRSLVAGTPTALRWILRAETLAVVRRYRTVLVDLFEA